MTTDEFHSEIGDVFARWNRPPKYDDDDRVMQVWARELRPVPLKTFREAIVKLSKAIPHRFPTLGMVTRACGEIEAARKAELERMAAKRGGVDHDEPVTGRDYGQMALELDDLVAERDRTGKDPAWTNAFRTRAAHWRTNAFLLGRGEKPQHPKFSEMLKAAGAIGRVYREMPQVTKHDLEREATILGDTWEPGQEG